MDSLNTIINKAIAESQASQLPGRENGPADAYRHMLWMAETARQYGPDVARALGILHELTANSREATRMDLNNNELGIVAGQNAGSWDEIVARVRPLIDPSKNDPLQIHGGPIWLEEEKWQKWHQWGQHQWGQVLPFA